MATAPARLMTFAEFEQLPDPAAGRYELVHGEVILVPPAVYKHHALQRRLREMLRVADTAEAGYADSEFAFWPGEHDYYICDVAWVNRKRADQVDPNGYFQGAPELVIEILSPSNTASQMMGKEKVSLATGAREFWVVSPDLRLIKVSTPDGHTITYKAGDRIPLFFAEGKAVEVDSLFA